MFICQRIGRECTVRAQDAQVIHEHNAEQEEQLCKIKYVVDEITSAIARQRGSQQVIDQSHGSRHPADDRGEQRQIQIGLAQDRPAGMISHFSGSQCFCLHGPPHHQPERQTDDQR